MAGKSTSPSKKAYYAKYPQVYAKNRRARLERTIREQPNNEQAKLALKDIVYRRSTPKEQEWSATKRKQARLIKEFTGYCDPKVFSANQKESAVALAIPSPRTLNTKALSKPSRSMFSIETRANGGRLV